MCTDVFFAIKWPELGSGPVGFLSSDKQAPLNPLPRNAGNKCSGLTSKQGKRLLFVQQQWLFRDVSGAGTFKL